MSKVSLTGFCSALQTATTTSEPQAEKATHDAADPFQAGSNVSLRT